MTARVLVVDDVRSNRKLLQTRLSLEYFEVLAAANGPDAIAICEKGGCDIVLLDVRDAGHGRFRGLPTLARYAGHRSSADRSPHCVSTARPIACAVSNPALTIS